MPLWDDTDPETEKTYIGLLKSAGVARRAELALNLSRTAIKLAYGGLRRRNPDASENEIRILFAEIHHGTKLAEALRSHLMESNR